jgi:uncharacterized protein (TIGR03067 family)
MGSPAAGAALLALVAFAPASPDGLTAKDLQGVWIGARFTEGNGSDPKQGVALVLTFKDNLLVVRKESNAPVGEATFTLSADGKSIDATGTSGGYRNKTYLGILKVEGDTLTWSTNGTAGKNSKRPGGFTADPGGAVYLIVAKRQKP